MTFNPTTAYLNDYQHHDFIEYGEYAPPPGGPESEQAFGLKVKRFDASAPDIQNIALALGISAEDSVLLVWNPPNSEGEQPPFDPKSGGMMILAESGKWVIENVNKSRFGHYEMGVTKATENAGAST